MYRTAGSKFLEPGEMVFGHLIKLLGIHWGQFPEKWEIREAEMTRKGTATIKSAEGAALIKDGHYVKGLSGMSCVCPAWAILEVLQMIRLKASRAVAEAELDQQMVSKGLPPEGDAAKKLTPPTKADNDAHKEDFNRLLASVTQGKQPDDET